VKALEIEKAPLVYLVEAERCVYSGTGRVPFFGHPPAEEGRWVVLLAVDQERWVNDLVDEAIRDLLKKFEKRK
jgi:hypothetical protein